VQVPFAMKIHYLQHVPFEDLANIESWARSRDHDLSKTLLFAGDSLPRMPDFDWLIIMGGPMNIHEEDRYPWLAKEKEFIHQAIASDKIVLGICLGAQLMADVLGGKVRKNVHREIGWFPVKLMPESRASPIFRVLPEEFMALHWHGDTFLRYRLVRCIRQKARPAKIRRLNWERPLACSSIWNLLWIAWNTFS
jgi:GMP synthase-like glutamine amidotransferase